MKIKRIGTFRTVTNVFNPGTKYPQIFEEVEDTVKEVLRLENNEFEKKFNERYKILNNRPSVMYSYYPTFIYVTDTRSKELYVFNMVKKTYTTYAKIKAIYFPKIDEDFFDTTQILSKVYGIKSAQNYPLDREVYMFDDIDVEMLVNLRNKDSCFDHVEVKNIEPCISEPVVILHLKHCGGLLKNKSEHPKGMNFEPECTIL